MDARTTSQGRREDFRLVSGKGQYTADWNLDGQAHASFLRSDHAHAEIASIDTSAALAVPGVLAVLTGEDVVKAGFKTPPAILFMKGKGGSAFKMPHRHALAHERVRFVGEPVALVVAETEAAAQDGVERIAVGYRDLPPAVTTEDALAPSASQLHADVPGNLAMEYEYGALGPVEAAFAKAAHVVRMTLDAQRISGNPMEPKACLAAYDAASGTYNIYLPTQGMADVRGGFAHVAGVAPEKIRIHANDVGGGFGVRNEVYPEFAALFLAARLVGRPVKWVGTRAESILSDHHGRGAKLSGALALDAEGNFLAIHIEWLVNMGAYASNAGPFINTGAAPTSSAVNIYRTQRPTAPINSSLPTQHRRRRIAVPAGRMSPICPSALLMKPRASPALTASHCDARTCSPSQPFPTKLRQGLRTTVVIRLACSNKQSRLLIGKALSAGDAQPSAPASCAELVVRASSSHPAGSVRKRLRSGSIVMVGSISSPCQERPGRGTRRCSPSS